MDKRGRSCISALLNAWKVRSKRQGLYLKMKIDESKIVAKGEWKYGGITPCYIVVHEETTWPGSGDIEDTQEIAEDREIPCFSVWYESPSNKGSFNAGGGYYHTVEEAIKAATKIIQGPVIWNRK